jgi:16S rRNA (cytidine1402-2'-O)-methyltransferase
MANEIQNGSLYIVSTPIGNLGDITFRAIDTLKGVSAIAAEDSRVTSRLLSHYEISKPMISYHDFNKEKVTPQIIVRLKNNESIALVTDAGTPLVSDPGFYLVREAVAQGINIIPIPGASALLTALVVAGLPSDRFTFEGFLPKKKGRQTRLKELALEARSMIFYESPQRIEKTIPHLLEYFGNRNILIGRELTKKFEEFVHSDLETLSKASRTWKGELVMVVEGKKHGR